MFNYSEWIKRNEPDEQGLYRQRNTQLKVNPLISIVVPVFNPAKHILEATLNSVDKQTYTNWELCIADGGSNPEIRQLLSQYAKAYNGKIKVKFLTENKGIATNTNEAIALATGDFVTFLDHDDTLAPFALFEIAKCINENPTVEFIYTNEDKVSFDGKIRHTHHFKPKIFSPDLLRSCNHICHLSIYKKSLLDEIGGINNGFEGSQDYDIILRATETAKSIKHIPKVLYHWKEVPGSTAVAHENKPEADESAKKAIAAHIKRIGLDGEVTGGLWRGSYHIKYNLKHSPLVSIIIPNKNQCDILKRCIESLIIKTSYKNYEIIIMENDSTDTDIKVYYEKIQKKYSNIKVIEHKFIDGFNYPEINNHGASFAKGELLLFLNNDTEIMSKDWLAEMVGLAQREDVGIVGAKLYFPNGTIQHAGVQIGPRGAVGLPYYKISNGDIGYMGKLKITQNMMAVTGACLLTKKDLFILLGGFDTNLKIALNDVEYCVRVHEYGKRIVWTPYAELIHHESITRGYEDTPEKQARFRSETNYMYSKWKSVFDAGDPYFI